MYPHPGAPMPPPPTQKPETFMLSQEAQNSLPHDAQVALQQVDNPPVDWQQDQLIRRFLLPTGDYVSCILWSNLFHISGTDIVRCLAFRFQAFGRPVKNSKKFEEGIFSDLRNLKAGTDATLEEPKSAFLDFLYKNNCIRTQKKQKVFYWYSVPHDRLFLDALERDLKREKMNQEATTVAVSEPAMSFEFDSSQSLYEQLTKAQQANSSSFAAHASTTYGQPNSPVVRTVDAMPPPQMAPPAMPLLQDDSGHPAMYGAPQMPLTNNLVQGIIKREQDYGPVQYDRNGMPMARIHQRHSSMPTFYEYSPAPSFVSSQYEDYSNRGLSFEPVTPPQHSVGLGAEPAYIANEDTGLYTAIPDLSNAASYNPMMQLPPSNFASGHYPSASRSFSSSAYPVIEGSPTYKQRRRRPSVTPGASSMPGTAHGSAHGTPAPQPPPYAAHRPSDLRRSVSSSVAPVAEGEETAQDYSRAYPSMLPQKDLLQEISRHGTPLQNLDESVNHHHSVPLNHQADDLAALPTSAALENTVQNSTGRSERAGPGPARRARSATMMELGPYPHKSHSCPIPSCGRLFKRLEHLKRHRRIHEAQQDGQPALATEEDLENDGEFDSPESSPPAPAHSHPHSMVNMPAMTSMATPMSIPAVPGMASHMIAPQMLQQQL
ncbi:unnamed protein product [Penicillium pancosmium]